MAKVRQLCFARNTIKKAFYATATTTLMVFSQLAYINKVEIDSVFIPLQT